MDPPVGQGVQGYTSQASHNHLEPNPSSDFVALQHSPQTTSATDQGSGTPSDSGAFGGEIALDQPTTISSLCETAQNGQTETNPRTILSPNDDILLRIAFHLNEDIAMPMPGFRPHWQRAYHVISGQHWKDLRSFRNSCLRTRRTVRLTGLHIGFPTFCYRP